MSNETRPREYPPEMPAIKTTIVGGRPPGCGQPVGDIPRGIEILIKKAAVDPEFRRTLLLRRAGAAGEIGLLLEPAEILMLNTVRAAQLEAIIARTPVESGIRQAFLGKAAAVMLAALGASTVVASGQADVKGVRVAGVPPVAQPVQPPEHSDVIAGVVLIERRIAGATASTPASQSQPTTRSTQPAPALPDRVQMQKGARADVPPQAVPAPVPLPAGMAGNRVAMPPLPPQPMVPASLPAQVPVKDIEPFLPRMDKDDWRERDAAQKDLEKLGATAIAAIETVLQRQNLSAEVRARLEAALRKVKPAADMPARFEVMDGLRAR